LSGGLSPDPLGSLQRSPDPLTGFKEPTSKEGKGRRRTEGEGREGKGRGGEALGPAPYT